MLKISHRFFLVSSAIGGMLGIILGAFAAHALKGRLDLYYLGVFDTAVRYQMYHSIVLFGLSLYAVRYHSINAFPMAFRIAQWCFFLGVIVFSGSLYLLVFSQVATWGAVTPIGGIALVVAWSALAWGGVSVEIRKGN